MLTSCQYLGVALLLGTSCAIDLAAQKHPCVAYSNKVSKLHACPTASSFCSSYLGGTATFTRTHTVTSDFALTTSTSIETETSTDTSFSSTVVSTASPSMFSTDTTTTVTYVFCHPPSQSVANSLRIQLVSFLTSHKFNKSNMSADHGSPGSSTSKTPRICRILLRSRQTR